MAFFPEFMHYTRKERKGIFILTAIILLLIIFPKTLPWFIKERQVDFDEFDQFMATNPVTNSLENRSTHFFIFDPNSISKDSLMLLGLPEKTAQTIINYRKKVGRFTMKEDLQKIYSLSAGQYASLEPFIDLTNGADNSPKHHKSAKQSKPQQFPFDPNTATETALNDLGMPQRVINTLMNFRKKGGAFYKKEDLLKIYGLDKELYASLEPYIQIVSNDNNKKNAAIDGAIESPAYAQRDNSPVFIDINQANTEVWQELKGIGPAYARRIVQYRNKLGGFSSVGQVGTTFGLPDTTFQKIIPYLKVSPVLKKININSASPEELKAHPLISWKEARLIANYRNHHGRYASINDLSKINALSTDMIKSIEPYLNFDSQ